MSSYWTSIERVAAKPQHVADSFDGHVGGRKRRQDFGIVRVVALPWEHGGYPVAPDLLHRVEDAELIVDHCIVPSREPRLDVVQLLLFMHVDQHVALDGRPQP